MFWFKKVNNNHVFVNFNKFITKPYFFLTVSKFSVLSSLPSSWTSAFYFGANASFSMLIFSKGRPWGLNIIMEIDLGSLLRSDSRGFTNLYCNWYLSYRFAHCAYFKICSTAAFHLHCHQKWWSIILIIDPLVWTKLNFSESSPWLWPNHLAFGKGPIIEPLVSLWVQTCFTACQPLALAPSFWWSFPQCLRDRIHFLTPFLIGFSADV